MRENARVAFDTEPKQWFDHWARSGLSREPVETVTLVASAAIRGDMSLDLSGALRTMDMLAGDAPTNAGDLVRYLARQHGYGREQVAYDDPDSSFIDTALTKRRGLPLSLSIIAIGVAARVGVDLRGIGLPGHFIVRDAATDTLFDPYHGGRIVDLDDCEAMFTSIHGHHAVWDSKRHLVEVDTTAAVERMLANLRHAGIANHSPEITYRAVACQMSLPGTDHRLALTTAPALAETGRLDLAADLLERAADVLDRTEDDSPTTDASSELRSRARMLRARLN